MADTVLLVRLYERAAMLAYTEALAASRFAGHPSVESLHAEGLDDVERAELYARLYVDHAMGCGAL